MKRTRRTRPKTPRPAKTPPDPKVVLVRDALAELGAHYAATGDPVLPWQALRLALERREPMPAWVSEYLMRAAEAIVMDIGPDHRVRTLSGAGLRAALAAALGFAGRGRGVAPARWRAERDAEQIFADVMALRAAGHKPYMAVELVATAHGKNKATVWRAYHAARLRDEAFRPKFGEPYRATFVSPKIAALLSDSRP